MNKNQIEAIDTAGRLQWTYKEDAPGIANNLWRSHADDVLAQKPWQGDCSDLTSTVLDLLGRQGLPLANRYRLVVVSGVDGNTPDHLIGCAVDDGGIMWVVGDTNFSGAHSPGAMPYGPFIYNRLSEEMADGDAVWRQGFPWK